MVILCENVMKITKMSSFSCERLATVIKKYCFRTRDSIFVNLYMWYDADIKKYGHFAHGFGGQAVKRLMRRGICEKPSKRMEVET